LSAVLWARLRMDPELSRTLVIAASTRPAADARALLAQPNARGPEDDPGRRVGTVVFRAPRPRLRLAQPNEIDVR
jgi:hypothetical protein